MKRDKKTRMNCEKPKQAFSSSCQRSETKKNNKKHNIVGLNVHVDMHKYNSQHMKYVSSTLHIL